MGSFFKRKAFNSLLFFESLLFFYCYNLLPRQDFGLICCIDEPKPSAASVEPLLQLHRQHLCSCLKYWLTCHNKTSEEKDQNSRPLSGP